MWASSTTDNTIKPGLFLCAVAKVTSRSKFWQLLTSAQRHSIFCWRSLNSTRNIFSAFFKRNKLDCIKGDLAVVPRTTLKSNDQPNDALLGKLAFHERLKSLVAVASVNKWDHVLWHSRRQMFKIHWQCFHFWQLMPNSIWTDVFSSKVRCFDAYSHVCWNVWNEENHFFFPKNTKTIEWDPQGSSFILKAHLTTCKFQNLLTRSILKCHAEQNFVQDDCPKVFAVIHYVGWTIVASYDMNLFFSIRAAKRYLENLEVSKLDLSIQSFWKASFQHFYAFRALFSDIRSFSGSLFFFIFVGWNSEVWNDTIKIDQNPRFELWICVLKRMRPF